MHTLITGYRATRSLMQLKSQLKTGGDVLLVHQMGRVGSMTVVNSLKAAYPEVPLYHTHFLNPERVRQRYLTERRRRRFGLMPLHLKVSRALARELKKGSNNRRWKVVTIVRDPVARNVSTFFHSIALYVPNFHQRDQENGICSETMVETFVAALDHDLPLKWFDLDVKSVFGIDVYRYPFPTKKGYSIISQDDVSLLIIRLEDLQECYRDAFAEFLNLDNIQLIRTHITENEDKRGIYKRFVENLSLPEWYLTGMYASKYATHFYDSDEIDGFRRRWSKGFSGY